MLVYCMVQSGDLSRRIIILITIKDKRRNAGFLPGTKFTGTVKIM